MLLRVRPCNLCWCHCPFLCTTAPQLQTGRRCPGSLHLDMALTHPQSGPSGVTAAHLDLLALQLCFNENKPNSAKSLPPSNLPCFGGSGWGSISTSSAWHQWAVRSSSFSSRQSAKERGYVDQAEKAVSALMPQHQKQKQLSFGKADVAFNSLTAGVRRYITYFPRNMNAIEDILGKSKFCRNFIF